MQKGATAARWVRDGQVNITITGFRECARSPRLVGGLRRLTGIRNDIWSVYRPSLARSGLVRSSLPASLPCRDVRSLQCFEGGGGRSILLSDLSRPVRLSERLLPPLSLLLPAPPRPPPLSARPPALPCRGLSCNAPQAATCRFGGAEGPLTA